MGFAKKKLIFELTLALVSKLQMQFSPSKSTSIQKMVSHDFFHFLCSTKVSLAYFAKFCIVPEIWRDNQRRTGGGQWRPKKPCSN